MLHQYKEKTTAYVNGKILTVDSQDTVAQAMLVAGDRIVATGDNQEILNLAPPWATQVDLEGRTVVPGIVDSHVHVEMAVTNLELGLSVECPQISTVSQLLSAIEERAKTMKP